MEMQVQKVTLQPYEDLKEFVGEDPKLITKAIILLLGSKLSNDKEESIVKFLFDLGISTEISPVFQLSKSMLKETIEDSDHDFKVLEMLIDVEIEAKIEAAYFFVYRNDEMAQTYHHLLSYLFGKMPELLTNVIKDIVYGLQLNKMDDMFYSLFEGLDMAFDIGVELLMSEEYPAKEDEEIKKIIEKYD